MKRILILIFSLLCLCSCHIDLDEKTMVVIKADEYSGTYDLTKYYVAPKFHDGTYNGEMIEFTAPRGKFKVGDTLTIVKK